MTESESQVDEIEESSEDSDPDPESAQPRPPHLAPETNGERWEGAGRAALAALLERHLNDLVLEIEETAATVEGGFPVTADHVGRLRETTAALETTVEESLARLAEGTRPWETSARRIPDWRLAEELGLDPDVVDGVEAREAGSE